MKVIIINGSPRIKGLTAHILHCIEDRLLERGAEVEFYDLIKLNMKQCTGCCACYRTGCCIFDDDAEKLSARIAEANGVVIGSPTYASNVSGLLKQFTDRGHFVIEQLLHRKYAVSVATGENYGSGDTSKILTKLLSYSGAAVSGKIIHNAPFDSEYKNTKEAADIADRLYSDIASKKKYPIRKLAHKIIFSAGIKPFVKKKGEAYQGVINKWQKLGIK